MFQTCVVDPCGFIPIEWFNASKKMPGTGTKVRYEEKKDEEFKDINFVCSLLPQIEIFFKALHDVDSLG
jgi:hypothetical protein